MIRMHRQAIQRYFDQRGEDLLDARWQRFLRPRELALTMEDAIFDVTFVDRKGREHRATCRSDRAGVFLADDESE